MSHSCLSLISIPLTSVKFHQALLKILGKICYLIILPQLIFFDLSFTFNPFLIFFFQSLCAQVFGNSKSTRSWASGVSRCSLPRFHITRESRDAVFPRQRSSRQCFSTRRWRRQHVDYFRTIATVEPEPPIIEVGSFAFVESRFCPSEVAERRFR